MTPENHHVLRLIKRSKPRGVPHCTANIFLISLLDNPSTIQDLKQESYGQNFETIGTSFVSKNGSLSGSV